MIRYLPYVAIEKDKWDACIANAANGNIYSFSWYLDSCCECWDALVEDDYNAIMPLPHRKKAGFSYIYPPSLIQQLGIFSASEITAEKVAEFFKAIPAKFLYIEINLNHYNPAGLLKATKSERINLELDLNKSYEELRQAYSENLRRNLKKVPDNFFTISKAGNLDDLISLFKSGQAEKITTLPKDFYEVLKRIYSASGQRSACELWQVFSAGELYAGVFFVTACRRIVFLFSASSKKAKDTNAMHFLIDSFINEHAQSPMILDFEGSDNGSLARFYKSFGATEKNYTKVISSKIPGFTIKLLKFLLKIKKQLF